MMPQQQTHLTRYIIVLTQEQLERDHTGCMQQLLDLNRVVFPSDASGHDLGSELRHRTARVVLALDSAPGSAEGHKQHPSNGANDRQSQLDHSNSLLGFAVYHTNSLTAHVARVAVAENARRRGLGGALLQAALRRAVSERRVQYATLHVSPLNAAAVALYRRHGFGVVAEVQDYYGRGAAALRMALNDLQACL